MPREIQFDNAEFPRFSHYLFRFPAKFHPPVARHLVETYSEDGDWILDPFCGSGSLMVEAATLGRHSVGMDIDPLAVLVSWAKTHRFNVGHLRRNAERLLETLQTEERPSATYDEFIHRDLTIKRYEVEITGLAIPHMPNLFHWFRRYVIVDLATMLHKIDEGPFPETHRKFFRVCLASSIRNSSNADPVPVSGLEVTKHMREREKRGRLINPFANFRRALNRGLEGAADFSASAAQHSSVVIRHGDALDIHKYMRRRIDVVITSPPYHNAVDYYRRHKLEMFWLGLVRSRDERLALKPKYLGAPEVRTSDPLVRHGEIEGALAQTWENLLRQESTKRAAAFKHYWVGMTRWLEGIARLMPPHGRVVLVLGNSTWRSEPIPSSELISEAADRWFVPIDHYSYPLKNRYMSYSRQNGASIRHEHVLVLERK